MIVVEFTYYMAFIDRNVVVFFFVIFPSLYLFLFAYLIICCVVLIQ